MFLIDDKYKCLEPSDVIYALQSEGIPSDIVTKANSFTIQHGRQPNTGYFLIIREDYDKLTKDEDSKYPTIKLKIEKDGESILYERLTITNAVNIFGKEENKKSVVLIKLEDYRWWMKKFYCDNFRHNFLATNRDFGPPVYKRHNTLKGTEFYSVDESLSELINLFVEQAQHGSFSSATFSSDGEIGDYLHNLEFADCTILDALCKISEAVRVSFVVKPNGAIHFITKEAEWPKITDNNRPICETIDFGPSTVPKDVNVSVERETYQLYDDRCDINHPDNIFFYTKNNTYGDADTKEAINVPYLVQSDYLQNDSEIRGILDNICDRFLIIRKAAPRVTYWVGVKDYHNDIGFGLDQVTYSSTGVGMITTLTGKELDQMDLNFRNPPFPVYKPNPHGMWLYRFTLKQEWQVATYCGGYEANSDILRACGEDTEYDEIVKDPFGIFQDMGVGDSGWCIELCDTYYAIQAPCP